jgi:hypothetical protein
MKVRGCSVAGVPLTLTLSPIRGRGRLEMRVFGKPLNPQPDTVDGALDSDVVHQG